MSTSSSSSSRCIGTGAIRSMSSSTGSSSQSDPLSPSPPPSRHGPDDPYGIGESPYGPSSRMMRDMTKVALGTASFGRNQGRRNRKDSWGKCFEPTPKRQYGRQAKESGSGRKWKVEEKGWVVDVKQGSSPKVLRTYDASQHERSVPVLGTRTASNTQMPRRVKWSGPRRAPEELSPCWADSEYSELPRGRVLGVKPKETIPLVEVGNMRSASDEIPLMKHFPVHNPTTAQVQAYKHYERKSRRQSSNEYAPGFAPVAVDYCSDDHYGTKQPTAYGAEVEQSRENDHHHAASDSQATSGAAEGEPGPRIIELDDSPPQASCRLTPECSPPKTPGSSRPGLLIYRKPVGSSMSVPLASKPVLSIIAGSPTPGSYARSTSSPTTVRTVHSSREKIARPSLRSVSTSPPKQQTPLRRPQLDPNARGASVPCAFPTVHLEPEADEPWPPTPTPAASMRLRQRPTLLRATTMGHLQKLDLNGDENPIKSAGVEDERFPERSTLIDGTVTWELDPHLKIALGNFLALKNSFLLVIKVLLACYVAMCLWSFLDAMRASVVCVLWPFRVILEFSKWIVRE